MKKLQFVKIKQISLIQHLFNNLRTSSISASNSATLVSRFIITLKRYVKGINRATKVKVSITCSIISHQNLEASGRNLTKYYFRGEYCGRKFMINTLKFVKIRHGCGDANLVPVHEVFHVIST